MKKPLQPDTLITEERAEELGRCFRDYKHFIATHCRIYDSVVADWIPFRLWPAQMQVLDAIHENQLTIILKARQLGISWLALSYGLWTILFRPIASVSIFSRRETEAIYMISNERLRGIYNHLPAWMKTGYRATVDSGKEWILSNGSAIRAFPTSAGDSYVSTLAIMDEADLAPDLNQLMGAVKPTIDTGGKLVLLSRSNKAEPNSEFKRIYRGAKAGENAWHPVFLPWTVHPQRDELWYERQRRDVLSRTGSLDDLYEQYPATDTEALAAKTLDKRISPLWLIGSYEERKPIRCKDAPALPQLEIYYPPVPGKRYVLGADPAEGNPTSDDSALIVVEIDTGREAATLTGKVEPSVFASYIAQISAFYNHAPAMVERNNHGHSVIAWLEEHGRRTRLLLGHDAEIWKTDRKTRKKRKSMKAGWLSSTLGKTILYTSCSEFFRASSEAGCKVLYDFKTYTQLCSIEASSLAAPQGDHDDRADAFALAIVGREQIQKKGYAGTVIVDKVKEGAK